MARILVVDDDASLRRVLEFNLSEDGHGVTTAPNGDEALRLLSAESFDMVLTDIKMPGMDGMDLLKRIKEIAPSTEVIVLTAFGTIEMAVEAMKAGAFEYVTKPFNRDELKLTVRKGLRMRSLEEENRRLKKSVERKYGYENIIGESEAMQRVFRIIEKVAETDATVLINGESGTGKELVARALHQRSGRAGGPFVAINCAAIPKELLESELFGHAKGAFTGAVRDKKGKFAEANGGTLFLDEIGELSIDLQAKILRAIQEMTVTPVGSNTERKIDVRILSATNRNLEEFMAKGGFREDLYYRLAVVPITVPSLRERKEDIPLLIRHFLRAFAPDQTIRITPEAMRILTEYPWKGNVRELENSIESLLILRESDTISPADLPRKFQESPPAEGGDFRFTFPREGVSLEHAEKLIIEAALKQSGGNQSLAARLLQIPRHVLTYRMEKYEIQKAREQ